SQTSDGCAGAGGGSAASEFCADAKRGGLPYSQRQTLPAGASAEADKLGRRCVRGEARRSESRADGERAPVNQCRRITSASVVQAFALCTGRLLGLWSENGSGSA